MPKSRQLETWSMLASAARLGKSSNRKGPCMAGQYMAAQTTSVIVSASRARVRRGMMGFGSIGPDMCWHSRDGAVGGLSRYWQAVGRYIGLASLVHCQLTALPLPAMVRVTSLPRSLGAIVLLRSSAVIAQPDALGPMLTLATYWPL